VPDDALLDRLRQLRQRGTPPKQIATALGMSASAIAPLVRQVAALDQARHGASRPASRAVACGFLVDAFCLGFKNAVGPLVMGEGSLDDHRRRYFQGYDEPPATVPVELAQHLVHGAVAYARGLGLEPHADFAAAAPYLGFPAGLTPIRFGREGKPCYISGPYVDARAIVRTLQKTAGTGNFDVLTHL